MLTPEDKKLYEQRAVKVTAILTKDDDKIRLEIIDNDEGISN